MQAPAHKACPAASKGSCFAYEEPCVVREQLRQGHVICGRLSCAFAGGTKDNDMRPSAGPKEDLIALEYKTKGLPVHYPMQSLHGGTAENSNDGIKAVAATRFNR
jgi:hypothetical protein